MLQPGQLLTGCISISERLCVNETKVRRVLKNFESDGQIDRQTSNKNSLISIANWDFYQNSESQNDGQVTDNRRTSDGQVTTNKNVKNVINNNTCSRVSRFNDFFNAYPKQKNMIAAEKEYVLLLFNDQSLTESDLIVAAENYADAVCILGTSERFIKMPNRFLAEGTYVDYLDKNYVKPKREEKKSREPTKQFNEFMKTDYDFEELEKQILAN